MSKPFDHNALEVSEEDKHTPISKEQGEFIFHFLRKTKLKRTLEIGFAYGFSSAYIMAATGTMHYAIDPYEKSYQNLGLKNLKKLGYLKRLKLIPELSHTALPALVKQGLQFDFAFIDGGHKFDEVFLDFYYIDLLLSHKGYVLFDDSWMESIKKAASWIRTNKPNYREHIHVPEGFLLFQKVDKDGRHWHHYNPF